MINLKLTSTQFGVVYALLSHVRLGADSLASQSISELLSDLEYDGVDELINEKDIEVPELTFSFSNSDGIVIDFE